MHNICTQNGVVIIADEIHGDLTRREVKFHPLSKVVGGINVVVCSGANKSFNIASLQASHIIVQDPKLREDDIVSWANIPGYVIVFFVDLALLKLPKQYPEQYRRSIIHMPLPLYNALCIAGMACDVYLIYCLAIGLNTINFIMSIAISVAFFAYAWLRIKTKGVDVKKLDAQKEAIAQEILDYEKTQN